MRVGSRGVLLTNSASVEFVPASLRYSIPLVLVEPGSPDLLPDSQAFLVPFEVKGYFAIAAGAAYEVIEEGGFERFSLDATRVGRVAFWTPFLNLLDLVVITRSDRLNIPIYVFLQTTAGETIRLNPSGGPATSAPFVVGDEPKASYDGWTTENRGYFVKGLSSYEYGNQHGFIAELVSLDGTSKSRVFGVGGAASSADALAAGRAAFPEGTLFDGAEIPANFSALN